jgi:hypothetical protein
MFYRPGHNHFLRFCFGLTMRISRSHRYCELRFWTGLGSQISSSDRSFDSQLYRDPHSPSIPRAPWSMCQCVQPSTDFHLVPNLRTDGAGCKYCLHVVFRQKVNFTPAIRWNCSVYILNNAVPSSRIREARLMTFTSPVHKQIFRSYICVVLNRQFRWSQERIYTQNLKHNQTFLKSPELWVPMQIEKTKLALHRPCVGLYQFIPYVFMVSTVNFTFNVT